MRTAHFLFQKSNIQTTIKKMEENVWLLTVVCFPKFILRKQKCHTDILIPEYY